MGSVQPGDSMPGGACVSLFYVLSACLEGLSRAREMATGVCLPGWSVGTLYARVWLCVWAGMQKPPTGPVFGSVGGAMSGRSVMQAHHVGALDQAHALSG